LVPFGKECAAGMAWGGRIIGILGGWLAAGLAASVAGSAPPPASPGVGTPNPPWRVLVLNGGDFYIPGAVVQDQALREALREGAAPRLVAFQAEALDAVSFDFPDHEREFVALLRRKHGSLRFDLVVPMGDAALRFAERHRDMWPGAPLVFFSVSRDALAAIPISAVGTTGICIDFDEAGTLALARRLQPQARRVVLVAGASEYDRYWWPRLEDAVRREGRGLEVVRLLGRPLDEVLAAAAEVPPGSIVLYTTISQDGAGRPYTPRSVAEQLARTARAPVYAIFDPQIGSGVVGGSMESLAAHGRRAAELALRVLGGTKAHEIPIAGPVGARPIVDWRQLARFSLPAAALPAGTEVQFEPPTLWEQYRGWVVAIGLALGIQTTLILALLAQSRRRRNAEAEATRQRTEAAHAARLSAVGELTASIAHEINQPLGAILSNAEAAELFLDADPPRLDRVRQILADIRQEDLRASEVIREVRALARKEPPQVRLLSMNDVVRDVTSLVEADARRRGVTVELHLSNGLPPVSGDRVQLQQVLLNLCLNGLEAMGPAGPGGRRLQVRTHARRDGVVELAVADSGPGLGPDALPRLFESFFTTKPEGLGLGLSIARSIVDAHGGRIAAGNNAGPGATFRISLPAAVETEGPPTG
jgi:signal transduction histidine kinase